MSAMYLLLAGAGALLLMVMLGVVVLIARHLDGSSQAGKQQIDAKMSELAARASKVAKSRDTPRWLATTLTSMGAGIGDGKEGSSTAGPSKEEQKQIKAAMTGLAIAGGVIMVVVGIVTGNG